jgi:hypothetical protein
MKTVDKRDLRKKRFGKREIDIEAWSNTAEPACR